MTSLPRRRKPQKMSCNSAPQIRSPGHLAWIRGHECSVQQMTCEGKIEAAHVRGGTDGGLSVKPSDCWAIPLCSRHHRLQHQIGEPEFERAYKIRMKEIADALWYLSPHKPRKPVMCEECGVNPADPPRKTCPGCDAYREHQA